jgi:hypothetical protein
VVVSVTAPMLLSGPDSRGGSADAHPKLTVTGFFVTSPRTVRYS